MTGIEKLMSDTEKPYVYHLHGIPITIECSEHSLERLEEREHIRSVLYASIMDLGDRVLDMKRGRTFAVINHVYNLNAICIMHARGMDITIDVITVLEKSTNIVKKGTKVFVLERLGA